MKTIICRSIYGNKLEVPAEKVRFRIGVYALILRGDAALLVTNRSSAKFAFPGGGVEIGEKLEDALRRELREEAGLEIEIVRFLDFHEDLFYCDPKDEAFHSLQMYYLCRAVWEVPPGFTALDDESEAARWVDWRGRAADFHSPEQYALLARVAAEKNSEKP